MKIKIKKDRPGVSRIFFDGLEVAGIIDYTLKEYSLSDTVEFPTLNITLCASDLEMEGAE